MATLAGGDTFLFLDDLYHLQSADQVRVLDYFHLIAKGTHLWIKVGTVQRRNEWYNEVGTIKGMKLGDDADYSELDLTLETFDETKQILVKVFETYLMEVNLKWADVLTPTALDRLVWASGGVVRDFLNVFRSAVQIAQRRLAQDPAHRLGPRVSAEDVGRAGAEYFQTKCDELWREGEARYEAVIQEFEAITHFCIAEAQTNIFLVPKDSREDWMDCIHELINLRLVHKFKSRVKVRGSHCLYEVYMLDSSQYTGERWHDVHINTPWEDIDRDELRKARLIYRNA